MGSGIAMTGMASGINTDELINELLALEMQPVQRMEQEKEEITTKQDVWQEINQNLRV